MNGFLSRWARLKAEAATAAPVRVDQVAAPPVDEATLPRLDTLTGDSDITAFLAAGVSAALQSQALQVVWQGDARIASFRGLADYDWDFNAASYGRLGAADDVAALLRQVIGDGDAPPAVDAVTEAETVAKNATGSSLRLSPLVEAIPPAEMQTASGTATVSAEPGLQQPLATVPRLARRHGGALPA